MGEVFWALFLIAANVLSGAALCAICCPAMLER